MIDRATVQLIKDTAEIVDVVSDYVHLTRRGANYMGLCPFHNEKTPSFSVSPRRNFCYCFSCHKGGSPVNFIMEKEGVSYHDALLHLAKKYGIKVEERELTDEERQAATEREGLMIAAQRAMQIMENDLTQTQEGQDIGLSYLYGRGITEQAIRKFHLGYALDSGNYLTSLMQREGYETDKLRTLGLTGLSQSGNLYDKYRGRVIFPILNSSGKVVGFGGRDLKGGPAKYVNSPESVLYRKNLELYGIFQAKSEIVRQDRCYLVEGYFDVISMWQSGIQNVVASSGTALTDGQINMIHRFTNNITLLYDGDSAGIKAALRGIDMLLSHKMQVSVLLLPDGHDPDSFARNNTPEQFREFVKAHETDIIRFKMQVLMENMGDSAQEKARVINSVAHSIACIPNDVQRTVYIGECSREMKIDEGTVAGAVEAARQEILRQQQAERRRREAEKDYPVETSKPNSPDTPDVPKDSADTTDQAESNEHVDNIVRRIETIDARKTQPLLPIERNLIKYLVRYGYVKIKMDDISPLESEGEDEDNLEVLYTLTDLVNDELKSNSLAFSNPVYARLFNMLLEHLDEYVNVLDSKKIQINKEIGEIHRERLQDIPSRVSTLAEIEREEKKLDQEMKSLFDEKLNEFSRNYPGNYLASHEDSEIRTTATELLNDPHVLSGMFTRYKTESPEDNLIQKITRVIAEWKSELLNLHLKDLLVELQNSSGDNPERDREIQLKIASIMRTRAQIAKECGERIICSR